MKKTMTLLSLIMVFSTIGMAEAEESQPVEFVIEKPISQETLSKLIHTDFEIVKHSNDTAYVDLKLGYGFNDDSKHIGGAAGYNFNLNPVKLGLFTEVSNSNAAVGTLLGNSDFSLMLRYRYTYSDLKAHNIDGYARYVLNIPSKSEFKVAPSIGVGLSYMLPNKFTVAEESGQNKVENKEYVGSSLNLLTNGSVKMSYKGLYFTPSVVLGVITYKENDDKIKSGSKNYAKYGVEVGYEKNKFNVKLRVDGDLTGDKKNHTINLGLGYKF